MMRPLILFPSYIHWHYSSALLHIYHISRDFLWFVWHFFSISILAKTFFAPWQRLEEAPRKKMDVGAFMSAKVINAIMRIVGALIRTVFIGFGCVALGVVALSAVFIYIVWIMLPFVIVMSFLLGAVFIYRAL